MQKLAAASNGLGSIVEACCSAVPFLAGSLHDWADQGAHALQAAAALVHDMKCIIHRMT